MVVLAAPVGGQVLGEPGAGGSSRGHREAIGTQAEYRRLLQALTEPPATAPEPTT